MYGCILIHELYVQVVLIYLRVFLYIILGMCLLIIFTLKMENFTNCPVNKDIRDYSNYPVSFLNCKIM